MLVHVELAGAGAVDLASFYIHVERAGTGVGVHTFEFTRRCE